MCSGDTKTHHRDIRGYLLGSGWFALKAQKAVYVIQMERRCVAICLKIIVYRSKPLLMLLLL